MSIETVGRVGERIELGRYRLTTGERVLYGQRVNGIVRVVDVPVDHPGRCLVVERGLTSKAELDALVADYLAQAARLDEVPGDLDALYPREPCTEGHGVPETGSWPHRRPKQ